MAADLQIDSSRGEQWCDAVEAINQKVDQILQEVASILESLGQSDKGGTIGEKLMQAAAGYLEKFAQMIDKFAETVKMVADFIGKAVEFATKVIGTISTIAKIVAVFV